MTAKLKTQNATISELAEQSLLKGGGSVHVGAQIMAQEIKNHLDLYVELMDPLVQGACYDRLRRVTRNDREANWTPPNYQGDNTSKITHLAAGTLMMFTLPTAGNKLIKMADRTEIEYAAKWYESSADNMTFKARWLRLVADGLPDGKTVGKHFSETELRKLQEQAGPC